MNATSSVLLFYFLVPRSETVKNIQGWHQQNLLRIHSFALHPPRARSEARNCVKLPGTLFFHPIVCHTLMTDHFFQSANHLCGSKLWNDFAMNADLSPSQSDLAAKRSRYISVFKAAPPPEFHPFFWGRNVNMKPTICELCTTLTVCSRKLVQSNGK